MVAEAESPTAAVAVEELIATACDNKAALDAGVVNEPKPNAKTIASEIRLNIVNLDIDFLSEVAKKTIFSAAGKDKVLAS
jgi:hypothetical protein